MINFTTRNIFLVPSFDLDVKEEEKLYRFLKVLEKSNVSIIFPKRKEIDLIKGGRPSYSAHNLFATILYGFAFGNPTLRDLEEACKYDLRYFYLMEQERPKHSVFGDFINDVIVPNTELIFSLITNTIIKECNLEIEDVFIDGSKFEANAIKYKFVWKPTKFHLRLSIKLEHY